MKHETIRLIGPAAGVMGDCCAVIEANLTRGRGSAIMLAGASGTGKTSIANNIINQYGSELDTREYNGTDLDVYAARDIRSALAFAPFGRAMVVVINEFHAATAAAQDALLTILDTLPARAVIVCTCNFPEKLSKMTQTRFVYFDVPAPCEEEIAGLLMSAMGAARDVADDLARRCGGSVRQAMIDCDLLAVLAGRIAA